MVCQKSGVVALRIKRLALILHSFHELERWEHQFNASYFSGLLEAIDEPIGVSVDYLWLIYVEQNTVPETLMSWLRRRVRLTHIDLVAAVLPAACEFLFSYGEELFPGTANDMLKKTTHNFTIDKGANLPPVIGNPHQRCGNM